MRVAAGRAVIALLLLNACGSPGSPFVDGPSGDGNGPGPAVVDERTDGPGTNGGDGGTDDEPAAGECPTASETASPRASEDPSELTLEERQSMLDRNEIEATPAPDGATDGTIEESTACPDG